MRKLLPVGLLLASLSPVAAQNFPTVPSNTVLGRTQIGSGPAQAIPITQLFNTLLPNGVTSYAAGSGITFTGSNPTTISLTTDTTNASNITSGTLAAARLPTVFTAATAFQGGISVGPSAAVPGTTDLYNYNSSRAPVSYLWRDQILSTGSSMGDAIFQGKNLSGTLISWVDNFSAPPFCRGKPSFSGFPCSSATLTAGTEEGAFYVTNKAPNTITLSTNSTTAIGNATLHFASSVQDSGNLVGKVVADTTTPSAIPAGTVVIQETSTTVVMSNNAAVQVGNGDSITFTGNDQTWFDSNGVNIGGQRNIFIPAGQGVVSFDKTGTATYNMSFNSHANDSLDFQSCNDVGQTCSAHGSANAMRFYVSAAGTHGPLLQLNYDYTITMGFANGGAGATKICLDSSNRLTTTSCP